jgi:signal recognition particle GTPase
MFENLAQRLGGVFDRLNKQGALSEADVATALIRGNRTGRYQIGNPRSAGH